MESESSTMGDGSNKKEIKLHQTTIYRLRWDRLPTLQQKFKTAEIDEIRLNWNRRDYKFDLKLFSVAKESKCNLVQVIKNFIAEKEYLKTYDREAFILIAVNCDESLQCAFAICTGAAYHKILPYVDTTFAYSVSKKILNPKSVAQLKCRFLNGRTISIAKLFHKDKRGTYLPSVTSDSFFIVEGFQADIKPLSDLRFLSSLQSSIRVTRNGLKILTSLRLGEMLCLLDELLQVHLSNDYKEAEEFEFLDYVKPVKSMNLIKKLDHFLERYFFNENKFNISGFFICHKNYEKWVMCEEVKLLKKTWKGRPDISDIFDAMGEENHYLSTVRMRYKSNGKRRSDKLLNYINGHVLYNRKYYFHIGKDWFKVDVEYIRILDHEFFKLVEEKSLSVKDLGYLPLPWCSEHYSEERINADRCIAFCSDVLRKGLSEEDRTKIECIFHTSDQKSEHGQFPSVQDDEETIEDPSSANDDSDTVEKNDPSLPASYEDTEINKGTVSEEEDDDDDDGGNSMPTGKKFSTSPRLKRRKCESKKYKLSDSVKSQLSEVIGEIECKLCLKSLTLRNEEKYNKMYYVLLNQFLAENPKILLNKDLGVDPDNKFPTFLHGDRILVNNIELFDILKITKDKVYLYHVKAGFGQNTRDAASQISISASWIKKAMDINQITSMLGEWYEHVMNYEGEEKTRLKLKKDLKERNCLKEDFLDLFIKKKIVYVYAFLDDTKGRKPFNDLLSPEQRLVQKEDFYEALKLKSQKDKHKIDMLCEYLILRKIIARKDNGFCVERKFLSLKRGKLFKIFKAKRFSDRHAHILFHTLQKHFVPTVSIKSHIAKFELIQLAHEFNSSYPDFELKFCQIRKP